MDKKIEKKYKDIIKTLRLIGMDKDEIREKIFEMENLKDLEPITLRELMSMGDDELNQLKSYCWHDGKYRCDTIGITNLKVLERNNGNRKYWVVSFSDNNGDPHFEIHSLDTPIKKVGDGEWDYGLFKKK